MALRGRSSSVADRPVADEQSLRALPGSPWEQRRRELHRIFARIEPHYDRLNRILSLGLDSGWREWAARSIDAQGPWLDLASGTGDLAAHLYRRRHLARSRPILIRSDLVADLLPVGLSKLTGSSDNEGTSVGCRAPANGRAELDARANVINDDSPGLGCEMDSLPFARGSLGAIVQGFALRHCRDYSGFFNELHRVLRPGGQIAILDMRYPAGKGSGFYRFYFRAVLPRLAALLGGDRAAYRFLVDSVRSMPEERVLLEALRDAGFSEIESRPGLLGSVRLLLARKPGTLAGSPASAYSPQSDDFDSGKGGG